MDAAKFIGFLTAAAYVLGFTFDLGYFGNLGLNLMPLESSRDHIEALEVALPCVVVLLIAGMGFRSTTHGKTSGNRVAVVIAGITLTAWSEIYMLNGMPATKFAVVWIILVCSLALVAYCLAVLVDVALGVTADSFPSRATSIAFASVGTLFFVFVSGNSFGVVETHGSGYSTKVAVESGEQGSAQSINARLLRVLDGGILLIREDAPDRVSMLRWSAVKEISIGLR